MNVASQSLGFVFFGERSWVVEKILWCNITHGEGKRILGLFCIVKIGMYAEETFLICQQILLFLECELI